MIFTRHFNIVSCTPALLLALKVLVFGMVCGLACILICGLVCPGAGAAQGVGRYYIRYDIKSTNNRIVDSTLVMVPADNDFRTQSYAVHRARGVTTAVPGDFAGQQLARARENALKQLLEQHGLRSVSTRTGVVSDRTTAMDTVISHEGAFIPPIEVVEQSFDPRTQAFTAVFLVRFSPIAFPDQWKWLGFKARIKSMLRDMISLF